MNLATHKFLAFSPSIKKLWIDDLARVRNPSYFLLGLLTKALSYEATVFVPEEGVEVCGKLRPYNKESVDTILLLGVDYSPGSNGTPFKPDWSWAKRAFSVAEQAKYAYNKNDKPPKVVFLSVDVRGWEKDATELLGFAPDVEIGESDLKLHFQHIGIYFVERLIRTWPRSKRIRRFGFHGHAKRRFEKFQAYVEATPVDFVIDGSGWEKLKGYANVELRGAKPFVESAQMVYNSYASLTLHEPDGEAKNWITSRLYENFGFNCINFIDADYDKAGLVIPTDSILRVTPATLYAKYREAVTDPRPFLAEKDRILGPPLWRDFSDYFYMPFRRRLMGVLRNTA